MCGLISIFFAVSHTFLGSNNFPEYNAAYHAQTSCIVSVGDIAREHNTLELWCMSYTCIIKAGDDW